MAIFELDSHLKWHKFQMRTRKYQNNYTEMNRELGHYVVECVV